MNTAKRSVGGRIFDICNYTLLTVVAVVTLLPFIHVVAGSFATSEELLSTSFLLFPKEFSLDTYHYIFSTNTLMSSMGVSVYVTLIGTAVSLLMTCTFAYPLAHRSLMGRKWIMNAVIFTMLFSGGMIPGFLVVRMLGLIDSLWALILPGAISAYNMILLKNFFQTLPLELEESAKIDGCNDLMILFRIILPLSLPALATFGLFYAVGYWNNFFNCILYINDFSKWTVQVLLRQIVIMAQGGIGDATLMQESYVPPSQNIKMATIVVSTLPIMCVYPFLQKYFTSGLLLGSVKG